MSDATQNDTATATPTTHRAAHHATSLVKGAAHHVGALLLMTVLRGVLVTAVGASGMAALTAFLPDELHVPASTEGHPEAQGATRGDSVTFSAQMA